MAVEMPHQVADGVDVAPAVVRREQVLGPRRGRAVERADAGRVDERQTLEPRRGPLHLETLDVIGAQGRQRDLERSIAPPELERPQRAVREACADAVAAAALVPADNPPCTRRRRSAPDARRRGRSGAWTSRPSPAPRWRHAAARRGGLRSPWRGPRAAYQPPTTRPGRRAQRRSRRVPGQQSHALPVAVQLREHLVDRADRAPL